MLYTKKSMYGIVEFETEYRPKYIRIDGVIFTRDNFYQKYGFDWSVTASGNMLYFMNDSGDGVSFPQKWFNMGGINK